MGRLDRSRDYPAGTRAFIPLFWRLSVPNATVLAVASIILLVEPADGRLLVLVGAFAPLSKLRTSNSLNEMLERLEIERRDSVRRACAAQEEERRRLAAELHDEIGRSLTALALQLSRLAEQSSDGMRALAASARDAASQIVDDVRAPARQLRPEALDELGPVPALTNLIERLSARTGLVIERGLERDLPRHATDAEPGIYRVAQESLTNVLRHAHAGCAEVTLAKVPGGVLLAIRDDGRGIEPEPAGQGGLRCMCERAISVGADLQITARDNGRGTEVRLRVPDDGMPR